LSREEPTTSATCHGNFPRQVPNPSTLLRSWRRPHHCVVVGVAVGLGGGLPVDAALTAAYLSVSGPATAAVRLLGLDPLVVNGFVARLGPSIQHVAEWAATNAAVNPADLPAPGAPGLDFLAEAHRQKEVRLFAS
jgi:urease accessory protein